jgi:hypothetical protein
MIALCLCLALLVGCSAVTTYRKYELFMTD